MPSTNQTVSLLVAIAALAACGDSAESSASTGGDAATLPNGPIAISDMIAAPEPDQLSGDACPYATVGAVNAAIRNPLGEDLVLRWARDGQCEFNTNIGFAVRLRGEPKASARPPEEMAYNLDNPALVEKVSGPGTNASIVLDPTWKDDAPRPFAMTFELGQRQYTITTTGLETSRDQLRALAEHIVGRLEGLPDDPFPQQAEATASAGPCSAFAPADLQALFGASEMQIESSSDETGSCDYKGLVGTAAQSLRISVNFDRETGPPTASHYDFQPFEGDDRLYYQEFRTGAFGNYDHTWLVLTDTGRAQISVKGSDPYPMDQAVALARNLQGRLQ